MDRLIGVSIKKVRHCLWHILPALMVVFLSLFAAVFANDGPTVHATHRPLHKSIGTIGIMRYPLHRGHSLQSSQQSSRHVQKIAAISLNKAPELTLTRTTLVDEAHRNTHELHYVLSVSNGYAAGRVEAGNTITISNPIPAGLTGVTAHAKNSDWRLKLVGKPGSSMLTATYIGAYPVLPGARLAPIMVYGTLGHSTSAHIFIPALVHTKYANQGTKHGVQPQERVRAFTVKALTTPQAPPPYQVGQNVTYTLSVTNDSAAGPVLAGDAITITDSIPAGLTGLTASATSSDWTVSLAATTSPTTLTATYVGTYPVAAGATLSPITINGTLTTTSVPQVANSAVVVTPNDNDNTNNTGTNTIPVVAQPDLTVTNTVPTGVTFQVGKTVTYTITGSNLATAGPVLAGDAITITDAIPAGLTGMTATASSTDWTVTLGATSGATTLTATYIGTYPVNAGTSLPPITLTGTLTAAAIPQVITTATITTPHDSNAANNTAANTITVVAQPDLTVTKTAPGGTYQVGLPVTYTITGSNGSSAGPVIAGDAITITDSIPTGLTSMTATGTNWTVTLGATTSPTTLTATYTGAYPVAAGASLPAITLSGTLTSSSAPQVVNTATITTPNDSNAANNSGSNTLPVQPLPDLTVTNTVPTGVTFQVGKPVTYTITGSNLATAGSVLAGDAITITDAIPAGMTGMTASGTNWTVTLGATSGATTLTATYIGTYPVAAGASLPPITLTGTLTSAAVPQVITTATISTPHDGNAANNTAANTITVVIQPDLTVTKTAPGGTYQVGLPVTYTITGSNGSSAGPVIAGDAITITDSIPTGLTSMTATGTNWTVTLGATTSPTTLTATYTGAYPVAAGASLPAITLSGTLTSTSTPQVVNSATITTPNDSNAANNSGSNTLPVQKLPDLTVTNTVPTGVTFQVGKPVTYTITGSNLATAGSVLAGDAITITDAIPAGMTGMTATGTNWTVTLGATSGATTLTATYTGAYPVAAGASLPPITLTGTLTSAAVPQVITTATISTPHDSNAANNTAANTITVVAQPDLTVTKTAPGGTYQVGLPVTYTITGSDLASAGPVIAGDAITITDSIPTGLTSMTATGTNWTVTLGATTSPTTLTATYTGAYPVAAGASLPAITLTGTLTSTSTPQVVNSATITTPNDSNAANNSGSNTLPVQKLPDLTVTNTVPGGVTFQVGKPVTYTITGSNLATAGSVLAGDAITITDAIPAGMTGMTATGTNWTVTLGATSGATTLTATYIGAYPVAAGASLPPITLTGTLTSAAVPQVITTATISTPHDSNAANNTAANTITVVAQPDLTVTKTVPGGTPLQIGHTVTYTITASNGSSAGPVIAGDAITITDSIPTGITSMTATGTNWTISLGATTSPTTLTATYTGTYPVAAGASLSPITLSGTLTATSYPTLANTATVSTPNDSNAANNSATSTNAVLKRPDLSLTKTVA